MTKFFQHTITTTAKESAMRMTRTGRGRGARSVAAVAAIAAGLLAPGTASAGEYAVDYCQGSGNPKSNAWGGVGSPQPVVGCTPYAGFPDDGVYFNSSTLPENGYGGLRSVAPPGARFKRMTINLRVPYQAISRRTYVEANSAYVFNHHNTGSGYSFNPDGNFFTVDLNDSNYFEVGQACHGTGGRACEAGDFYFYGLKAYLEDTTAPTVTADAGKGVFDSARQFFRGNAYAEVDITDSGHGPAWTYAAVDGTEYSGSRAVWLGSCNYRLTTPCAARLDHGHGIDTTRYSDGVHTIRVVGDDGMGQAAFVERTVTFDNTAPTLPGVSPIDGQTHTGEAHSFTVTASDATSGIERIESRAGGAGGWHSVDGGKVTVRGAGSHTVEVRAVDRAGNVSAVATSTFTLTEPPAGQDLETDSGEPLPGAPGPGDVVRCEVGEGWSEGTRFAYQWLRDGVEIAGAVAQTYTVTAQDVGRQLVCRVVATNPAGSTERETPPVVVGEERCFGQTAPTQPCGDYDNDGTDNQTDPDDDNDGVPDGTDPAPFDPNVPGGGGSGSGSGSGAAPSGTSAPPAAADSGSGSASGAEASRGSYVGPPNNGANASNNAKITVEGTRRRTVAFGRRIATVAHLRNEHGRPITGAQVSVLQRTNVPGAQWREARAPLVSDSRGRLRWVIPAKESRTIRYAYKANLANAEFQSTSDVVLTVFSKSTLKVNRKVARNGQSVTFGGRLMSRPVPRGGILIDLQAKVGKRWQTFRTIRTKVTGKWKAAYRFRSTRGVQVYTFRARVRQDSAYPYAISTTRAVKVKVVG